MFSLQQFTIEDNQSSMKVGTDAILLGCLSSYTDTPLLQSPSTILDIGTGCGLIALMMAQRFPLSEIQAIDIDKPSIQQAIQNFEQSPWKSRLHAIHSSLQDYQNGPYDLIVSNPPFFTKSLKGPNHTRNQARHNDSLPFSDLFQHAQRLLSTNGRFCIVVPTSAKEEIDKVISSTDLHLHRHIAIQERPDLPYKRSILTYSFSPIDTPRLLHHSIRNIDGHYTPWYYELTKPFLIIKP